MHKNTTTLEWTHEKGPITDIRERRKPYDNIQRVEHTNGYTINDPRFGGLFGFGAVVTCPPPEGLSPTNFWNNAWEVTTRQRDPHFLVINNTPLFEVEWSYTWGDDEVAATVMVTPQPLPLGWWYKEPKLVFNGFVGMTDLIVFDSQGSRIQANRLADYPDPRHRTIQVKQADRTSYILLRPDNRNVRILCPAGQWQPWYAAADKAVPLSNLAIGYGKNLHTAPAYCLDNGHLKAQTEITHWTVYDTTGVAVHGWEGGYGAPDCHNTFRPFPVTPLTLHASVRVARGILSA